LLRGFGQNVAGVGDEILLLAGHDGFGLYSENGFQTVAMMEVDDEAGALPFRSILRKQS
jgi:hypothetical protein